MKQFFFGFGIALFVVGIGAGSYYLGTMQQNNRTAPTPSSSSISSVSSISSLDNNRVGGDQDEHGCIGSAGYGWCAQKNKCLRIWEEKCDGSGSDDAQQIIKALCTKNGWNESDMIITINKNDGTYASGGVKTKTSEVGGGYFFAAKKNGVWNIVADGNGTIPCENLIPYPDYPNTMIPECFDEKTGNSIKR